MVFAYNKLILLHVLSGTLIRRVFKSEHSFVSNENCFQRNAFEIELNFWGRFVGSPRAHIKWIFPTYSVVCGRKTFLYSIGVSKFLVQYCSRTSHSICTTHRFPKTNRLDYRIFYRSVLERISYNILLLFAVWQRLDIYKKNSEFHEGSYCTRFCGLQYEFLWHL